MTTRRQQLKDLASELESLSDTPYNFQPATLRKAAEALRQLADVEAACAAIQVEAQRYLLNRETEERDRRYNLRIREIISAIQNLRGEIESWGKEKK